ncbi:MAG: pyridoxamine 5'-phosphate oxidase family protein [Pseudomonadota bacterium]
MISDRTEFDAFVSAHRWAVLTTLRRSGSPVSSVVAYARDGDELVVSTPGATFKRRSTEANGAVNLCVISNQEPFNFVAIEGHATVEQRDLERTTMLVFDNITGTGFDVPEDLNGWLHSQDRVILRIRPLRVYGVLR